MGSGLHAETECQKVYAGEIFELQKKSDGSKGFNRRTVVAKNTPTGSFLTKIVKMQSAGCWLRRIAREARGESTDGLAAETHGLINSAGCEARDGNYR